MKLLTIGEFSRLTRLSQKALRLYDELGLLRPFRVDEWSGYRYYAPSQVEAARLVAWLRRLGLPLAQIGVVAQAPPAEAAAAVAAVIRAAEADLDERRRLAQFLIAYFAEGATAMPETSPGTPPSGPPLTIRYAAASDAGLVRERNQDTAYADPRLLAVADGFGPAGERASAAAVEALRALDAPSSADLLNVLSEAAAAADASVRSIAETDTGHAGAAESGSTLTAMLLSGSRLALVHIGDSRAYLLRDGGLFQITHDHSVTQALIDSGRLTPEEAASHPQRSLLFKALNTSTEPTCAAGATAPGSPELAAAFAAGVATAAAAGADLRGAPDLSVHEARAGDRYLLCSDGLTSVVPAAAIRETLSDGDRSPEQVVQRLIALANEAGGPDNTACAVADVMPAG